MNEQGLTRAAKRVTFAALERSSVFPFRRGGYRLEWSRSWTKNCDEALDLLPEPHPFDRETYRTLVEPTGADKRHVIVRQHGEPVAVVSLRRRSDFWEPVADQCLPGIWFPSRPGAAGTVASLLGHDIRLAEVELDDQARQAAILQQFDCHVYDLTGDYEEYWRSRSSWKSIRQARNRTKHMEVRTGNLDDVTWVVNAWHEQWKGDPLGMTNSTVDRIRCWTHLVERGIAVPLVLLDGDIPVAGRVMVARGTTLHGMCVGRDLEHPVSSLGSRVEEEGAHAAARLGFSWLDIGGYSEYKAVWAPARTARASVTFLPAVRRWRQDRRRGS